MKTESFINTVFVVLICLISGGLIVVAVDVACSSWPTDPDPIEESTLHDDDDFVTTCNHRMIKP